MDEAILTLPAPGRLCRAGAGQRFRCSGPLPQLTAHLLLPRGEQQLTPALPGQVPAAHQRCQVAGIDGLQARQIGDDLRLAGRERRERGRDTGGFRHVQLPAQRDDNLPAAIPGTQVHTSHKGAFPAPAARRVLTQR
jgi:hypothetical protein